MPGGINESAKRSADHPPGGVTSRRQNTNRSSHFLTSACAIPGLGRGCGGMGHAKPVTANQYSSPEDERYPEVAIDFFRRPEAEEDCYYQHYGGKTAAKNDVQLSCG